MQGTPTVPYFRSFATAMPQNPEIRHEILKAAQTLADENDPVRWRRAEIESIRNELGAIRKDIVELCRNAQSLIFAEFYKYGYNPDEPRVPKHQGGAGEWTRVAANDDPNESSDPNWFPPQKYGEGHHWVPKTVYKDRPFSKETKKVFDDAKSGALAHPEVNSNNAEHIAYNKEVSQLLDAYLAKNKIVEEEMTPAQARAFVQEVIESENPIIRNFVRKIRWERMRYYLRYGPGRPRGDEG